MEGQESSESDPCQGKLQKDLDFCTHLDVHGFSGTTLYVRDYRFKSHVYNFSHVFRDGQGNIKGQKMVQRV